MGLKFRRGTNAQKSGSLAFGEPYVNTDLGTLQIGGNTGDITLGASGTGSQGSFAGISGSSLDITGNAKIDGNLTLGGAITIGDASADTVNVIASLSSSLIPQTTNAFDLGSATKIWRDLYISTGSIKFVEGTTVVKSLSAATLTALETATGSQNTKNSTLATYTASIDSHISNLNTATSSYETKGRSIVSGSSQITYTSISSIPAGIVSGSSQVTGIGNAQLTNSSITIGSTSTALGATSTTIAGLTSVTSTGFTGALTGNASTATTAAALTTARTINGTSFDGSANITIPNLVSGSSQITYASISSIPAGIVSGSSQLSGTTITDLTVVNLTTVNETASVIFSSGSNRFGDAGNDTHSFTGSVQISGSLTTIGASTATSFNGTINATNGVVSGSAQIDGSLLGSNKTITIGSTSTTLGGTSTTIAGLTSVTSTGFTGALTGNASTATTLATARTINGTSFDGGANITIANLVSGSSQIVGSSITTNAITIAGTSTALGGAITAEQIRTAIGTVVTGSAQIAHDSTTGFSANKHIDHTAVTLTAGDGLTGGGDISASRTFAVGAGTGISVAADSISNTGVLSVTTNTGLSTNVSATGNVTITNSGVTSNVAGTAISVSGATGAVTITNTGVTSNVAGTGVTVSGATGAVTISIGQAVATSSNVQFNSLGIGMAASATAGRIDATNDVVAFSSSDIRFKENIVPIENALDKISKISGNTYDWKAENKIEHGYEGNDVGVIAQEIEAVLPQLVQTRENGFKAVKYDKLVALLIEGIKEQQTQIEKLRMDLDNYECKCDNCKSK